MKRAIALLTIAAVALPARALETDQFYAWTRQIPDATEAVNAWVNAEIAKALATVNSRRDPANCPCRAAYTAIREHFDYPVFGWPEMWARKTDLVPRVPATADEYQRFRRAYLYHRTSAFDPVGWMPPSPTIEIDGVRIGTDKLSHFFLNGPWLESAYRAALKQRDDVDEATRRAISFGIFTERTVLGASSSGIVSLGDLEANYQGLLFFLQLCDGPDPELTRTPEGWQLARPFDLRNYVTPEWDESWQPNIYTPSRWAKVRPVMAGYCGLLTDPEVQRQRAAYAARDGVTATEAMVRELVAAGKLADPRAFTIDAVCGQTLGAAHPGSGR